MLLGDIGLGDVSGDLRHFGPIVGGHSEIVLRAYPWQQQHRELAILDNLGCRLE